MDWLYYGAFKNIGYKILCENTKSSKSEVFDKAGLLNSALPNHSRIGRTIQVVFLSNQLTAQIQTN